MNPATLRTLREQLGLTITDCVELFGVSRRTWQYWESPDHQQPIKPDVIDTLEGMLDLIEERCDMACAGAEEAMVKIGYTERSQLAMPVTRYRSEELLKRAHPDWPYPFNFHCMMMGRLLVELQAEGFSAYMVYDDDPVAITGYDY